MPVLDQILAGLIVLVVPVSSPAPFVASGEPTVDTSTPPASSDWWGTVRAGIEAEEYHASVAAAGLQAPNRAENLRTYFRPGGIEIVPRTTRTGAAPQWSWRWESLRFGREGRLASLAPASPVAEGPRVRYPRAGLIEWYDNTPRGLEQGFTIERRVRGAGSLVIEGRVGGSLTPHRRNAAIEFIDAAGTPILSYGHLAVRDAMGRALAARLTLARDVLGICIDDRLAAYPLTVDPLVSPAVWGYESGQANANFGFSLATAGDVNGDGYSDVIVGAPYYDNGQADEGQAFIFHGSPSGLSAAADWTEDMDQADAHFGFSVAGAGDIDGDGYSDVIVGAPDMDYFGRTNNGEVRVFMGSPSGVGHTIHYVLNGAYDNEQCGYSVAGVGDIDDDGKDDFAFGMPGYGATEVGRAYYATDCFPCVAQHVDGASAGDRFGTQVAPAGDVNGDGYADVVLNDDGPVHVYHGGALGLTAAWTAPGVEGTATTVGDINGDGYSEVAVGSPVGSVGGGAQFPTTRLYAGSVAGLASAEFFSVSYYPVAPAGDANGDGYADVAFATRYFFCVCGNPFCFPCMTSTPAQVFLYQGSPSGMVGPTLVDQGFPEQNSPETLASAGDVNGDGFGDLVVAFPDAGFGEVEEGVAYVVYGKGDRLASTSGWNTSTTQATGYAGYSVASVGDVNGDGLSDVAVGGPLFDNGEVDEGRVAVYLGRDIGPSTTAAFNAFSNQDNANIGISVAGAGDVNGDGYADMIFGAPTYTNGESMEGRAYLFYGAPSIANPASWTAEGNQIDARFSFSVAGAGDVNGDGYGDILIGEPEYDNGQAGEGRVVLYLGSSTGPAGVPDWTVESNALGARMGWAVAGAGDVNHDGYGDVVIGSPQYKNGQSLEGRFDVYHGGAGGMTGPELSRESDESGARLGTSVATAGDVNGDGYSDVIVGAPYADDGESDEGTASVYLGSGLGLVSPPAWTAGADQLSALYGQSVGSAGDVNGDGYSDVIVGAPGYTNGQTDEGRAFVYLGSAVGLPPAPSWTAEKDQADASFGWSVAGSFDVNGDGFSDVIVGAPYYDTPNAEAGRAWIYYGGGGRGLERRPRQVVLDDSRPIDLLGLMPDDRFRLKALGRIAAGREDVRLQWEVKPLGAVFDYTPSTGAWMDTGAPGAGGSAVTLSEQTTILTPGWTYRWRLRIASRSPIFPWTRWFTPPGNEQTEADLRRAGAPVAVREHNADSGLHLESAPNPFRSEATITYVLPDRVVVKLAIYDIRGRRVSVLANAPQEPGRHWTTWSGRDTRGVDVAPGVYLVELTAGKETRWGKVVRMR
jgi:hypothetical protein